jgi:hypothetical protein
MKDILDTFTFVLIILIVCATFLTAIIIDDKLQRFKLEMEHKEQRVK